MTRILPADPDSRRIPAPRRPPDTLDDADRLALLAAEIMADRLDRYAAEIGPATVRDLMTASLQAQVTLAAEKAWAAWVVRAGR